MGQSFQTQSWAAGHGMVRHQVASLLHRGGGGGDPSVLDANYPPN